MRISRTRTLGFLGLAVASGLVSGETVLRHLNARGHGI